MRVLSTDEIRLDFGEASLSMTKPHIEKIKGTRLWLCQSFLLDKFRSHGDTPFTAYKEWRKRRNNGTSN